MQTSLLKASSLVSTVAIGLFTGLMFCFLVVIDRTLPTLTAFEYTKVMQQLIRSADKPPTVPLTVVLSVASPLVFLFVSRRRRDQAFLCTALAFISTLAVLYITVGLNVPINTAISLWNPNRPPTDWAEVRDHWHALNLCRTPFCGLAFGLHLWASLSLWKPDA